MSKVRKLSALVLVSLLLGACGSSQPAPGPTRGASAFPAESVPPSVSASPGSTATQAPDSIWNATLAGWHNGRLTVVISRWNAVNGDPAPSSIWEYDPATAAWSPVLAPPALSGVLGAYAGDTLTLVDTGDPPLTAVFATDWQDAVAPTGDALSGTLAPLSDGTLLAVGDVNLAVLDPRIPAWTSSPLPDGYLMLGGSDQAGRYLLAPADDSAREGGLGNDFHVLVWDASMNAPAPLADHAVGIQSLANGDTVVRLADGWYHLPYAAPGQPMSADHTLVRLFGFNSPSPFTYLSNDKTQLAVLDCHSAAVPGPNTNACDLALGDAASLVPEAAFGRRDVLGVAWSPDGGTLALLTGSRDNPLDAVRLVLIGLNKTLLEAGLPAAATTP